MTASNRACVDYWFTVEEWGKDVRTGAIGHCRERLRRSGDKPGASDRVWGWQVTVEHQHHVHHVANGVAQNQKGARAAIRRCVRLLPAESRAKAIGTAGRKRHSRDASSKYSSQKRMVLRDKRSRYDSPLH